MLRSVIATTALFVATPVVAADYVCTGPDSRTARVSAEPGKLTVITGEGTRVLCGGPDNGGKCKFEEAGVTYSHEDGELIFFRGSPKALSFYDVFSDETIDYACTAVTAPTSGSRRRGN